MAELQARAASPKVERQHGASPAPHKLKVDLMKNIDQVTCVSMAIFGVTLE